MPDLFYPTCTIRLTSCDHLMGSWLELWDIIGPFQTSQALAVAKKKVKKDIHRKGDFAGNAHGPTFAIVQYRAAPHGLITTFLHPRSLNDAFVTFTWHLPGSPPFLHVTLKRWDGLGTRLQLSSCVTTIVTATIGIIIAINLLDSL